jgi:hypothetical protein
VGFFLVLLGVIAQGFLRMEGCIREVGQAANRTAKVD